MTTLDKIEASVRNHPDRIAYLHNGDALTYRELWERAKEAAAHLKRRGTSPVVLYGHKGVEMPISIVACLMAGRPYVPVDLHTPETGIRHILNVTGSTLLIANEPLSLDGVTVSTLKGLADLPDAPSAEPARDAVYMIFTSGSTGRAKGIPISDSNLVNFIDWLSAMAPLRSYQGIRVLNQASFSFDLSVADLYYSLCNGHTLVGLDRYAPEHYGRMFEVIKDSGVNLFVCTPTFAKLCLLSRDFRAEGFPSLTCFFFCGEKLEARLVKRLFDAFSDASVINAYGPTEATCAVSAIEIKKEDLTEPLLPIGKRETSAVSVEIEDGEIVLRGKSVSSGYLDRPSDCFFCEGGERGYRTGDLGFFKEGKLYCQGRADEQIKYKGYRIELGDIERNLREIGGILDCAVVAKRDAEGVVKGIKAFAVAEDRLTPSSVKEALRLRVPSYMIPNTVTFLDSLPMNERNKIDKRLLSTL